MEALILAGGLGTRLAAVVRDRAKPVADVAGEPFLAHVLRHLQRFRELRRVILCVGHRAASVESALGDRFGRLPLAYARESEPLGTGGAIRNALRRYSLRGPALALNGDTYFPVAIDKLVARHRAARLPATLAAARVDDSARFGSLRLVGDRVAGFEEKGAEGTGWINGGVYVFGPAALESIRAGPPAFSLERDVLPALAAKGRLGAYRSRARFIDIGIPSDYARARLSFDRTG